MLHSFNSFQRCLKWLPTRLQFQRHLLTSPAAPVAQRTNLYQLKQFVPLVLTDGKHLHFSRCFSTDYSDINDDDVFDDDKDDPLLDEEYEQIIPKRLRPSGLAAGHQVLLIQPKIRYQLKRNKTSPNLKQRTTPQMQLDEAIALIDTLRGWSVLHSEILQCDRPESLYVFGTGQVVTVADKLAADPRISAVLIAKDVLSGAQQAALEEVWRVPVIDRYTLVLQIFAQHATTKASKLQVALAEIPYIRSRLRELHEKKDGSAALANIGGQGESYFHRRKRVLNERQRKLLKAIERIRAQRQVLREGRAKSSLPTVAVVGYTNSGKTTLIKSLTRDAKMPDGRNQLFATLDVTHHGGRLPRSGQNALFVDTIGFIADTPTALIEAFMAVLEEIKLANLIVHVVDLHNPNLAAQRATVMQTLDQLQLPRRLTSSILEVGNKSDLIANGRFELLSEAHRSEIEQFSGLKVSALQGDGLVQLLDQVEDGINLNTGRLKVRVRVGSGGEAYAWLFSARRSGAVGWEDMKVDEADANYLLVDLIISRAKLGQFTKLFGTQSVIQADDETARGDSQVGNT